MTLTSLSRILPTPAPSPELSEDIFQNLWTWRNFLISRGSPLFYFCYFTCKTSSEEPVASVSRLALNFHVGILHLLRSSRFTQVSSFLTLKHERQNQKKLMKRKLSAAATDTGEAWCFCNFLPDSSKTHLQQYLFEVLGFLSSRTDRSPSGASESLSPIRLESSVRLLYGETLDGAHVLCALRFLRHHSGRPVAVESRTADL